MWADLQVANGFADTEYDVVIVGGGAVGISLARSLGQANLKICLVESGGVDYDPLTQSLYAGENIGLPYYDLEQSRLRFLGGTTSIWGGRCARLDPIDLQERNWVEHSGWPIGFDELRHWYEQANFQFGFTELDWQKALSQQPTSRFFLEGPQLANSYWLFDERTERFNTSRISDVTEAKNIVVALNANATKISLADDGTRVTHIDLQSTGGRTARLRAKHFVLSCGAIENSRLLLASDDVVSGGIGNEHDQVGRYFMEHPNGRLGKIATKHSFKIWAAHQKTFPPNEPPRAPVIQLSPEIQEQRETLNSAVTIKLQRPLQYRQALTSRLYNEIKHTLAPDKKGRALNHAYRKLRSLFHRSVRGALEFSKAKMGLTSAYVIIRGEQAPNPSSRVVLSSERDFFGQRRAALNWQLSSIDKRTAQVMAETLDMELRKREIGHLETAEWMNDTSSAWPVDLAIGNHPIGGYHHMGGTRMSQSHATGVVDADCKVHNVANLYVAGSSVFPTGGWANPTYTAVALALRLADHLDRKLKR